MPLAHAKILIVDDNPMNIELAVFVLTHGGFAVSTAPDARLALDHVRIDRPDLILMDIQMPGMDGVALTRLLKADAAMRSVVVIAFTAYAMKGDEGKLLDAGCDGYLAKPINVATFAAEVRAFLDPDRESMRSSAMDWPNSTIDSML